MSNLYKLENALNIVSSMQYNFSYDIASYIFGKDIDHFWSKWLVSNDNILNFLNSLDILNRKKMLEWGETLVS